MAPANCTVVYKIKHPISNANLHIREEDHKPMQRLWRNKLRQLTTFLRHKHARLADRSVLRHAVKHPERVDTMDFQEVAPAYRLWLKFLNVIKEHRRLCHTLRVGLHYNAKGCASEPVHRRRRAGGRSPRPERCDVAGGTRT